LLGQRQRLLQRAERLFQVTAIARGDADRHRRPVLEVGVGSAVQQLAGLLREGVGPRGVAGEPFDGRPHEQRCRKKRVFGGCGRLALQAVGDRQCVRAVAGRDRCLSVQRVHVAAHRRGGSVGAPEQPGELLLGTFWKSVKRRLDFQRLAADPLGSRGRRRSAAHDGQRQGKREPTGTHRGHISPLGASGRQAVNDRKKAANDRHRR
jgi:hypothetical protein